MTDQCKHCIVRGDFDKCKETECNQHDNWYAVELLRRILVLELELGLVKISLEHRSNHLVSCEKALEERDA